MIAHSGTTIATDNRGVECGLSPFFKKFKNCILRELSLFGWSGGIISPKRSSFQRTPLKRKAKLEENAIADVCKSKFILNGRMLFETITNKGTGQNIAHRVDVSHDEK